MGHLAATMEIGLDGAPFKAPWFIRLIAKPVFKRTSRGFTRPMPAGYQLPSYAAQHLIPDDTALEEAFARLRHAVERWSQEPQRHPHPVFGKLTEEEWVRLQLRHAEMHMSFVLPMAN